MTLELDLMQVNSIFEKRYQRCELVRRAECSVNEKQVDLVHVNQLPLYVAASSIDQR